MARKLGISKSDLDKVIGNLNREIKKIEGRSLKGLIRGSIIVRRSMDETEPLIPVDKGNLRASWFTDPQVTIKGPIVRLGFTASYAWHVHENVGATFKRPGAGAKFFEAPLKRNAEKILKAVQEEARIK